MDRAKDDMLAWTAEVMPDATPEAFARKFAEEAGEFLGIDLDLDALGWEPSRVDSDEARDCALVLVAYCHAVGRDLGEDMTAKMIVNRSRRQIRQPNGTYHH